MSEPLPPVETRWQGGDAGNAYRTRRFRGARAAGRDPRLVARLLAGVDLPAGARVLDVPCGAGRLRPAVERDGPYLGIDVSGEMLDAARAAARAQDGGPRAGAGPPRSWLRASAFELPLADDAFDLVLCCRLLHHLQDDGARLALLRELVRVARGPLLVSFWDAGSWHALRRRRGWRRGHDHRTALSRTRLAELLAEAGARPARFAASLRFVSPQSFVLAHAVRDPAPRPRPQPRTGGAR